MKNYYYSQAISLFAFFCIILHPILAQRDTRTYSSSGQTFKSNGYTIDVTIGETFVNSFIRPGVIVSQGQHQPRIMTFTLDQVTPLLKSTEVSSTEEQYNSMSINSITAYPNPVQHSLTIELKQDEELNYSVLNMQGQVVQSGKLDELSTILNFENYLPGNYIFYYSTTSTQGRISIVKI